MPTVFLAPTFGVGYQAFDAAGLPLNAGLIYTYIAGGTTPQATYTTAVGNIQNANPIQLDADGRPPDEIWLISGVTYRFDLKDALNNVIASYDNISGINDVDPAADQWVVGTTPTYIGATQFSVAGDQTAIYTVGRRVRTTNTGGVVYGTITASVFTTLTTVTIATDSGSLDSGLSRVEYSFLTSNNSALPGVTLTNGVYGFRQSFTTLNSALGDMLVAQAGGIFQRAGLPTGWQNGTVNASVAANALTISLLDANGATPSTANPVFISFRNVTAASANPTTLLVTSATQLVISSGSTLGTVSAQANRIWIVAFNDAGTVRIGAINCLVQPGSGVAQIFPLKNGIASSTAEGGVGAADSGGVFYTGTAVTSKSYTVLGYIESTQATAGTWVTSISKAQAYGPGIPLPGDVVQDISKLYGAVATGTTAMVRDDSVPLISEGDEYMSQAITPIDGCNIHRVSALANLSQSNANVHLIMSIFANAVLVGATAEYVGVTTGAVSKQVAMQQDYVPGSSSAITYTVRAGGTTGATTTFNGASGNRLLGGAFSSTLTIQEIMS